ncbi:MAG: 1-acyl-sn-glycerol-3-phosphate acyltransferase, partial [Erysipelotrichaceae bacterium]
ILLKMTKTKVEVTNANLIPLEDGYFFISNHQSSYDGLILINSIPIDVIFYTKNTEKFPYLKLFVKLIGSIRYTDEFIDQTNDAIKEMLSNKLNVLTYINNLDQKMVDSRILDSSYQNHNAIIPIVIKHSKNMVKKAYTKVELVFCTPLHYEEYGSFSNSECMIEIQKRMDEENN